MENHGAKTCKSITWYRKTLSVGIPPLSDLRIDCVPQLTLNHLLVLSGMTKTKRAQRKTVNDGADDSFSGDELPSRRVRRRLEEQEKGNEKNRYKRKPTTRKQQRGAAMTGGEQTKNPGNATDDIGALELAKSLKNIDNRVLAEALKNARESKAKKIAKGSMRTRTQADDSDADNDEKEDDDEISVVEEPEDHTDEVSWKGADVESDDEQEVRIDENDDSPLPKALGIESPQQRRLECPSRATENREPMAESRTPVNSSGQDRPFRAVRSTNVNDGEEPVVRRHDPISVDESVLVNVMKYFKADFTDILKQSVYDLSGKIDQQNRTIDKLKAELNELSSTLTMTASILFNKQFGVAPKSKHLQKKLCTLPALFNERLITVVMSRCYLGFYNQEIKKKYDSCTNVTITDVEDLGRILLSLLFFSKMPNERKREKYASQLGQLYSKLRHGVLLSAIMAMQDNAFDTFLTPAEREAIGAVEVVQQENNETSGSKCDNRHQTWLNGAKITHPDWLAPKYICREHCDEAAARLEHRSIDDKDDSGQTNTMSEDGILNSSVCDDRLKKPGSSGYKPRQSKVGEITRHEVACEAAGMVYRIITNILHRCRDAGKVQMFHDLLYLFTGWGTASNSVDQKSLKMRWKSAGTINIDYVRNVKLMKEVKTQDKYKFCDHEFESTNKENNDTLRQFMFEHPELCLLAEHDVKVGGRTRRLRYRIYIIEVICKLLSAFSSIDSNSSATPALNVDKSVLKIVSVICIAFKAIVDRTLEDVSDRGVVMWANMKIGRTKTQQSRRVSAEDDGSSSYTFPQVDGVSLDMFQPSASRQKDILGPMCLNLKVPEFNMKNEPSDASTSTNSLLDDRNECGNLELGGAGIEADGAMAVFRFHK